MVGADPQEPPRAPTGGVIDPHGTAGAGDAAQRRGEGVPGDHR